MVFLGTPHQGTSFNRYGLIASYLLLPLDADIEIMRILAPESEELDSLQRDFERHYKATPRKYIYENKKTQRQILRLITLVREFVRKPLLHFLRYTLTLADLIYLFQVVTRQSATHGSAEMDTLMLETDHRGLNKFLGRDRNYNLLARVLLTMLPRTRSVSASEFNCLDEHTRDTDYPGRLLWYREKIEPNGYPAGVQVAQEYAARIIRPIGDTILTCRWSANALLRHRMSHIEPGIYHVTWIFWFWAGRNFPKSHEHLPRSFIPNADLPPENSLCERFFPSTKAGEGLPKLDSGFFFPWELRCSVGRPQNYATFMHLGINPRHHPLAAPVLLMPGYEDKDFEAGYWRTMKNNGWYEVKGQNFKVGEDGEIAFVVNNKFIPHAIGGFSFGGLRLEPIE